MKLFHRRYLSVTGAGFSVLCANDYGETKGEAAALERLNKHNERYGNFVRWLDEKWIEVEV